jgi:hypothetical protein
VTLAAVPFVPPALAALPTMAAAITPPLVAQYQPIADSLPALTAPAPQVSVLPSPTMIQQQAQRPRRDGPARVEMPITINVQAPPGADGHQLAALIEQHLRQATGDAARHISALYDDPDEV